MSQTAAIRLRSPIWQCCAQSNARVVAAALTALEDLTFGRQVGKLLGERHATGELTGLSRLRFDLSGHHPLRFRIVFRVLDGSVVE